MKQSNETRNNDSDHKSSKWRDWVSLAFQLVPDVLTMVEKKIYRLGNCKSLPRSNPLTLSEERGWGGDSLVSTGHFRLSCVIRLSWYFLTLMVKSWLCSIQPKNNLQTHRVGSSCLIFFYLLVTISTICVNNV